MEKRFQVFVSSTYQDLAEERQEVMHALLELDCIPSGMELFPAANEGQWSLIKRVIEDCDYYILIIAGRYGSCGPDGMSYTEKEYRYAEAIGRPIIAFLHKDPGKIQANKCEREKEGQEKLSAFRKYVENKVCKYWTSATELGSVVSRSLIQLTKTTSAVGWVRADELPTKEATIELLQLRRQVEELNSELAKARMTAPKGTEDFAQGEDSFSLRYSFKGHDGKSFVFSEYETKFQSNWNSIFAILAPHMINEASEWQLKDATNAFIEEKESSGLKKKKELANSRLIDFHLNKDDFQTIKVQLRALGLITKSDKPRSVKDVKTYWKLTPYGDEVMTRLRAIKRA